MNRASPSGDIGRTENDHALGLGQGDFRSLDGGVRLRQTVVRIDRYRHLGWLGDDQVRITRGGGLSYSAAGFGGGGVVVDTRAFDRILSFDAASGVLECEASATLGKIQGIARRSGWFLPVQPGHPAITIGGCVASDSHGKNPFRNGTFRRSVLALEVFHPARGTLHLDARREPELFDLTCGGFGLTGQIVTVRLQLERLPGRRVRFDVRRIARIEDAVVNLERSAGDADFLYTWHNLAASAGAFGRGFCYVGAFESGGEEPGSAALGAPFDGRRHRSEIRVPLLNGWTALTWSRLYEWSEAAKPRTREVSVERALYPIAGKARYFSLFGPRGFHESQLIFPRDAATTAFRELRKRLAARPAPVVMTSCKLFGGSRRYLRFDGEGVGIAMHFCRNDAGDRFAGFLDDLVVDLRGVPSIVKDSRLPRRVVEACYPEYDEFRSALEKFDPKRLYRSELSERLGL